MLPPVAVVSVRPSAPNGVPGTREHERRARTLTDTGLLDDDVRALFVFVHVQVTVSPGATLNVADRVPWFVVESPSSHETVVNAQPAGGEFSLTVYPVPVFGATL